MPKYRKKPVMVEAVQFLGTGRPPEIDGPEPAWYEAARTMDRGERGAITYHAGTLRICTLEGEMVAQPGDWIIQGVAGEIYPCNDAIFQATYQRVDGAGRNDVAPSVKHKRVNDPAINGGACNYEEKGPLLPTRHTGGISCYVPGALCSRHPYPIVGGLVDACAAQGSGNPNIADGPSAVPGRADYSAPCHDVHVAPSAGAGSEVRRTRRAERNPPQAAP